MSCSLQLETRGFVAMTSDEVLAWPMMLVEVLVETSIHVASVEVGTKIGNVAAKSDIWQPTFDGNNS